MAAPSAYFIGLMSGTSLDGVDGVLADFSAEEPRTLAHSSLPLPAALREELLALNQPGTDELHRAAVAAHQLVLVYAQVVRKLLQETRLTAQDVQAIGAHGQTVRHHPPGATVRGKTVHRDDPHFPPYTLQLNNPSLLAEYCGIPVVADFRSRDVAAGGQGAPLVPAFHHRIFHRPGQSVGVVNIGGIANLTVLRTDGQVLGLDTGPGNMLLDLWCARHTGQPYDANGAWAAEGQINESLLLELLSEPYFAHKGIKSTGRDLFDSAWLARHLASFGDVAPVDVQATLTRLTAGTIANSVRQADWGGQPPREILVCGGGALNRTLLDTLRQLLPNCLVHSTADRGWPVQQIEALAFAWLAQQTLHRQPGNLPQVTGARGPRVLGALYPA